MKFDVKYETGVVWQDFQYKEKTILRILEQFSKFRSDSIFNCSGCTANDALL